LDLKVQNARWDRWSTCSLCEQDYHGVVACALGWACWKTYLGRPETHQVRGMAMNMLGRGLDDGKHSEDALSVQEAELAMERRLGASEESILFAQSNLAVTYRRVGRLEEALSMRQEVYSGRLRLNGEEHQSTLIAANNYAHSLASLQRFEEAKGLLLKLMPVARRVFGESNDLTLKLRTIYATALYYNNGATLDELREAVTMFEDIERIARRVLGGAHPVTANIEISLRDARAVLRAREAPPGSA